MAKVSIVIPVYNVAEKMNKCIDAAINQTEKDIEIILVDDGSTDDSSVICNDYAEKDNRIKVIHKQNGGVSSARNAGIALATAKYVLLPDSDDYLEITCVAETFAKAEKTGADVVIFAYWNERLNDGSRVLRQINVAEDEMADKANLFWLLNQGQLLRSAWNKLYRRSVFDILLFKDLMPFEDAAFNYDLLSREVKVVYLNKPLHHYVSYGTGTIISTYSPRLLELENVLSNSFEKLVNTVGKNDPRYEAMLDSLRVESKMRLVKNLFREKSPYNFAERAQYIKSNVLNDEGYKIYLSEHKRSRGMSLNLFTTLYGIGSALLVNVLFTVYSIWKR